MAEWLKASVLKTEGCYHLAGSNPVPLYATVAQLGERPFCTWEVTGSSPVGCNPRFRTVRDGMVNVSALGAGN